MVQALLPTRAPTHEPSTGPQVAVSEYRYNALGWRTVKRFDTSMGSARTASCSTAPLSR